MKSLQCTGIAIDQCYTSEQMMLHLKILTAEIKWNDDPEKESG
jgi:hypothetical protein